MVEFNSSFMCCKVLKHLTIKRPVETSRMDFFAHAEAFAALVNMEFVSIPGKLLSQRKRKSKLVSLCDHS